MKDFKPNCLPLLIGSIPLEDHADATELVLKYTKDVPLWVQLPVYKKEGMIPQFMPGLPSLQESGDKIFINTDDPDYEQNILGFYEEYLSVTEGGKELSQSRFCLTEDVAKGFFVLLSHLKEKNMSPLAVKSQTTGPITFCTGVLDQDGRAIFYNEQLRDIALKLLAEKARWQVIEVVKAGFKPIMFFDEPALAGFGSSAFITISPEDVKACLNEVADAVHEEGALAGVHVCANTEWLLLFESRVDIISFDAYSFFDKFILFPEEIRAFFDRGGILASGIIPTNPEFIDLENTEALVTKFNDQVNQLEKIGVKKETILAQTFITPSCGTGSVSMEHAQKVLDFTKEVSELVRNAS